MEQPVNTGRIPSVDERIQTGKRTTEHQN